jgi:IclR family acetate operon transcriptional repressor
MTAKTITDEDVLLRELARTRDRGWAIDDSENEEGTRCIGVVVVSRRGTPVGGVSLSALAYDLGMDQVRQLAPKVVAAAERLSTSLLPL